ncbi:hypothetical protein C8J57DRAFT_1231065 [Mycena rebaudengoi]|nr:hypothetical protein C8J57DRAFT_1231065 [Mycena rebaudengoi]
MDHPYYMNSNPTKSLNIWASTALAGTSPRQIDQDGLHCVPWAPRQRLCRDRAAHVGTGGRTERRPDGLRSVLYVWVTETGSAYGCLTYPTCMLSPPALIPRRHCIHASAGSGGKRDKVCQMPYYIRQHYKGSKSAGSGFSGGEAKPR